MQKEYVQETKSSDSPFHTQDILLQSQNNEINQYNICSGKVDTESIPPIIIKSQINIKDNTILDHQ